MVFKSLKKVILTGSILTVCGCSSSFSDMPHQATGIKIGEVTHNTAIVWTRLTRLAQRVGAEAPMPEIWYSDPKTEKLGGRGKGRPDKTPVVKFPEGSTMETIEGAVPGAPGQVRVLYKASGASEWQATSWRAVGPKRGFTR